MCAMRPSTNGFWLSVCIAKVIGIFDHWVASMPRLAYEGLEPCDGNLARFLGGLGSVMIPGYPVFLDYWWTTICRAFHNSKKFITIFLGLFR